MKKLSASEIQKLYVDKLASSGLDLKVAKQLGFTIINNPREELADHFFPVPAFKIPYHGLDGKPTEFYRIRYLASTLTGFAKETSAKVRRYDQPAAELPQLYFPTVLPKGLTWKKIAEDPKVALVFTEGELKAACATLNGIPTIALGGVWNFASKTAGLDMLPIFDKIVFKEKEPK